MRSNENSKTPPSLSSGMKLSFASSGLLTLGNPRGLWQWAQLPSMYAWAASSPSVRALRVPYGILMPIIVIFCVTGAYSLKNNVFDVGTMLVFGVLGYAMKKLGYSPAALTLALVLGPLAERALRQSLIISDAGVGIFFTRPISAVLMVLALAAIAVPLAKWGRTLFSRSSS